MRRLAGYCTTPKRWSRGWHQKRDRNHQRRRHARRRDGGDAAHGCDHPWRDEQPDVVARAGGPAPLGSLPAPAVSAVAALSVVGVIAAICAYLSQPHTTFAMAGMQVLEMHPDWTPEDAGHFAGAATGAYCPDLGPST
jgi:hypothetical protein